MTPSEVDARAEREVTYALQRSGWHVYLPHLAAHTRIDLIAVRGGELVRIQCKTSQLLRGVIVFRTCSNTRNVRKDYREDVDAFGVYSPETDTRLAAEYELRPPG